MKFLAVMAALIAFLAFVSWVTIRVDLHNTAKLAVNLIPGKRFIAKNNKANPFLETTAILTIVAVSNDWVKYHYGDGATFFSRPIAEFVRSYVPYN